MTETKMTALRMTVKGLLGMMLLIVPAGVEAAEESVNVDVIPRPLVVEGRPGVFELTAETVISVVPDEAEVRRVGEYLAERLSEHTRLKPTVRSADEASGRSRIVLETSPKLNRLGEEGYELIVTADGVKLRAETARGLFYGVQTLRQLVPAGDPGKERTSGWRIEGVRIEDRPRYGWRGMHLDVGRHFMPVEFVKKYIDLLAYHKMNTFHWHLTEDQGWRIQIDAYPKLTKVGAWRVEEDGRRYGGFYTKDEVRDVVAHAASRFITVVPEIEMPGHTMAALAAYPELSCTGGPFDVPARWAIFDDVYCAGNDETFEFLKTVLGEVIELFPGPFIHVGGDECPKTRWQECAKCQARIKAEGLADEDELQSYFIKRIATFVDSKGRRLIGWDEILDGGLAPSATVMSWRGVKGGIKAASMGHDAVMSPTTHCYLDYPQSTLKGETGPAWAPVLPIEKVYEFEPTPAELSEAQAEHILGGQGNVWTEYMPDSDQVEYMAFPRLCAVAEAVWTAPERREWEDFQQRLSRHYARLDALGVKYRVPPPTGFEDENVFADEMRVRLETAVPGAVIRYTLDDTEPGPDSATYGEPIAITEDTVLSARTFLPDGRASLTRRGTFERKSAPGTAEDQPGS